MALESITNKITDKLPKNAGQVLYQPLIDGASGWAASFAYALTADRALATKLVSDAFVALVVGDNASSRLGWSELVQAETLSARQVRLAQTLLNTCRPHFYTGISENFFFRLSPMARATTIMKVHARFSRIQIAEALGLNLTQVDSNLAAARAAFTSGSSWIDQSGGILVSDDRWEPECPYWKTSIPRAEGVDADMQTLFAQYVGNDLPSPVAGTMHAHFNVCQACRSALTRFKALHQNWQGAVPAVKFSPGELSDLSRYVKQASKFTTAERKPSFTRSILALLDNPAALATIAGLALLVYLAASN